MLASFRPRGFTRLKKERDFTEFYAFLKGDYTTEESLPFLSFRFFLDFLEREGDREGV